MCSLNSIMIYNTIMPLNFESLIEIKDPKTKFKEEIEEGNIEYKLRLDFKTESSLKKMKNQMNWRFDEGKETTGRRECHYILGIFDNGKLGELSEEQIDNTFLIFNSVVKECKASILSCEKKLYDNSWIVFVSIIQILEKKITEINIGFVGGSQTGKTTTISNIVYGQLDDGSGSSRQYIFRHEHEKTSGMTSCIKKEIIGIKNNNIINYNLGINVTWEYIANMSDRILCLIDLPGSQQYMKTILFGLSAYNFDALVIFNDKNVENSMKSLYIEYAKNLDIPYIIVEIYDLFSPNPTHISQFNSNILFEPDIFLPSTLNIHDIDNKIINITNIKSGGIKHLISFLVSIKKTEHFVQDITDNIFVISDVVSIPDTGIIFSGEMWYGNLSVNDNVFLTNGNLTFNLKIQCINKKQSFSNILTHGEMGSILLSGTNMEIQKNSKQMIITKEQCQSYKQIIFETKSSCKILKGNDLTVYINNRIILGTVKEIDESNPNNKKYVFVFQKNFIFVPKIKNLAFAKMTNNIFIIDILI
jgi:GTPase